MTKSDYMAAGVDIDAGNKAVELMKESVKSTYGTEVLAGIGRARSHVDRACELLMSPSPVTYTMLLPARLLTIHSVWLVNMERLPPLICAVYICVSGSRTSVDEPGTNSHGFGSGAFLAADGFSAAAFSCA